MTPILQKLTIVSDSRTLTLYPEQRLMDYNGDLCRHIPLKWFVFVWCLADTYQKHTENPKLYVTPEIHVDELFKLLKKFDDPQKPGFKLFSSSQLNISDIFKATGGKEFRERFIVSKGAKNTGKFYSLKF